MILAGFPGIGKTQLRKSSICMTADRDSSRYFSLKDGSPNPNFVNDYLGTVDISEFFAEIRNLLVLFSTHEEVLKELTRRNNQFVVVIPDIDDLEVYKERFRLRGNSTQYIQHIEENWNTWLNVIMENYTHFILPKNGFLLDSMDKIFEKYDYTLIK